MSKAKELNRAQELLVTKAGLFHTDWNWIFEDDNYLHLARKNCDPAEIVIIDKGKKKVLAPTKAN